MTVLESLQNKKELTSNDKVQESSAKSCSCEFKSNQVLIKTLDDKDNCSFGYAVYVDGVYKRFTRNVSAYFEDETGSRVYFKKTLPENWNAP